MARSGATRCSKRVCVHAPIVLAALLTSGLPEPVAADPPDVSVKVGFPFGNQPIDYDSPAADNRVARLAAALAERSAELTYSEPNGYLRSALAALEIPLDSQVLVFSKTSVNHRLIDPRHPRAIYFNDDTYVAWVDGADILEISTVDATKGALFYALFRGANGRPEFTREGRCLACHMGNSSLRVPGHLVRSFATDSVGKQLWGYSRINHNTPLSQRWGGWYVTGRHGEQSHLGNLFGKQDNDRHKREPDYGGNQLVLKDKFDQARYLSPHSDIVALMTLDHQTYLQNLLVRLDFAHRLGVDDDITEAAVRYLTFADEPPLAAAVTGTSGFRRRFESQGPRDKRGRSLRQFDLEKRLFRFPVSYVIHTPAFANLSPAPKQKLLRRLWEVLSGHDRSEPFRHLDADQRQAALEILRETMPELPEYWRR